MLKIFSIINKYFFAFLNRKNIINALLIGIGITLLMWLSTFYIQDFKSFSLIEIHKSNFLLFITDLAPIISLRIFNYLAQQKKIVSNLQYEKDQIDLFLKNYTTIVKNIVFEEKTKIDIDDSKPLGKELKMIYEALSKAKEKENLMKWFSQGNEMLSDILRTHTNIETVSYESLKTIINYARLTQGSIYLYDEKSNKLSIVACYSYNRRKYLKQEYKVGYGLIGQAAYEMLPVYRKEIPEDYATLKSGILGEQKPQSIFIVPLIADKKLQGVIEVSSIEKEIPKQVRDFVEQAAEKIGQIIFNLKANLNMANLLAETQKMATELQEKQKELLESSEQIKAINKLLEQSYRELETYVEELKRSEQRIHSILEHASEVISIYGKDKKLKDESASVKNILGYVPPQMSNSDGLSYIHEQAKILIYDMMDRLIKTPYRPVTIEYKMTRKDGSQIWLEVTGRNFLDNKAIEGFVLNTRDITIYKKAEKEQRLKGRMQALSENSPDMIVRFGLNGEIYYANPMFEKVTSLKAKSAIDKKYTSLPLSKSILSMFEDAIKNTIETKTRQDKEYTIEVDKNKKIFTATSIPETNEEHELESILFVAHDITHRKMIELELKDKNTKIQDSINYAQRIQNAILPTNELLRKHFPKSFIFYKPKDVISGDFPWMFVHKDCIYVAVVDCTGHGVPGALLSVIGYFLLNNVVDHKETFSAAECLNRLNQQVRRALKQDTGDSNARDGMDIAFCKIDLNNMILEFAGAHRPLYQLRKQIFTEFKGDRRAIGGITRKNTNDEFTNHIVKIEAGDRIFIFSDGIIDQEGGPENKKYGYKNLQNILINNYNINISEIGRILDQDFEKWRGDNIQIDDVLVMGIEF